MKNLLFVGLLFCLSMVSFAQQPDTFVEQSQDEWQVKTIGNDLAFTVNGVAFTMKRVEGGSFQMGNDSDDAYRDERPVHKVKVSSFYMGETEVTQAL